MIVILRIGSTFSVEAQGIPDIDKYFGGFILFLALLRRFRLRPLIKATTP